MRISIVTISFNQALFLEAAIRSVIDQHFPDLEYIVVDPGSTDGSREIIGHFGPGLIRTIFEPDRGPADGLNKGFRAASGEILGYLNADDAYLPDSLREVEQIFASDSSVDVLCGGGYIIDGDGHRVRKIYSDPFNMRRYLYGGVTILQQSTFFRREAFLQSGGFNPMNRTCWDGELILAFARRGMNIKTVPRLWSGFRIHDASISGTGRVVEQYRKDIGRFFLEEYGRTMNVCDRAISQYYRIIKWLLNPTAAFHRIARIGLHRGGRHAQ